jgi:hypothetical protein
MIPRKNFAQPAIFCPAGRPDRVFQKVHSLGTSRTKDQNGKISKIRPTARASPAPIESQTGRHLARLPGSEKGTFPRNVSDKSPKNHFRRLYGCGSGGAKWPRARRKFFGRPGSSRKVHSLGMSRTKDQNVARNGVPFVRKGLGLGKNSEKISESTAICSELGRRHTGFGPAISPPVCPSIQKGTFARNVSDKSPKSIFQEYGSPPASLAAPSGLEPGGNFSAGRGPAERYIRS